MSQQDDDQHHYQHEHEDEDENENVEHAQGAGAARRLQFVLMLGVSLGGIGNRRSTRTTPGPAILN